MKQTFTRFSIAAILIAITAWVQAAFSGPYATNHWTLVNTNADGFIDASNAPASIRIVGGNNGSYGSGVTEWRITAPSAATLQFDWRYFTLDDILGPWDRAGYRVNTSRVELARNDSTNLNGRVNVNVNAGDTFAFWVRTEDNLLAAGELTITNFVAGPLSSPPNFTLCEISNSNIVVRFDTIPGRTYRLEATDSLPATNWVQISTNFVAVTNRTLMSVSLSNYTHRYFRATLLP